MIPSWGRGFDLSNPLMVTGPSRCRLFLFPLLPSPANPGITLPSKGRKLGRMPDPLSIKPPNRFHPLIFNSIRNQIKHNPRYRPPLFWGPRDAVRILPSREALRRYKGPRMGSVCFVFCQTRPIGMFPDYSFWPGPR
jgi:hypothetical protein